MARPLRIEFPGAWYHVMNRGAGRRAVFLSDQDRKSFLTLLGQISQTFHLEIHAYSLLSNHYHLLIHTPQAGLSRAMRHLNGVYTQQFNRRQQRDGSLFRGRYKALLVQSEEYLLELVRYIHLNPVNTGLCLHPKEHPWTSHIAYLQSQKRPKWLVTTEVLARFGDREQSAKRRMDAFVCAGVTKEFENTLKSHRVILGTSDFQKWVHQNFVTPDHHEDREIAFKDRIRQAPISPKLILETVAFAYNVKVGTLRKSQRGQENEARAMATYLIRTLTGLPQKEVAYWMKCPTAYTVATIQKRFKARMTQDKKLKKLTHELSHAVMTHVKT